MQNDSKIVRLKKTREGGYVKRCHTVSHVIGEYTNGIHQYNCLNILLIFHPNPPTNLIKAVQWHDICEKEIGDLPSYVGERFPRLRRQYKISEQIVQEEFDGCFMLSNEESQWLKAIDLLELGIWSTEQIHAGNKFAEPILRNVYRYISEIESKGNFPNELLELIKLLEI